jgi:hypothetical protein
MQPQKVAEHSTPLIVRGQIIGCGRSGMVIDGSIAATGSIACAASMAHRKGPFVGSVPGGFAGQIKQAADAARLASERADRAELGVEHGIGKDHLDLLGGGSRDDMASRAERLAPLLAASREVEQLRAENAALREGKQPPAAARPVANLHPGAAPVQVDTTDDAYPAHWIPQRA